MLDFTNQRYFGLAIKILVLFSRPLGFPLPLAQKTTAGEHTFKTSPGCGFESGDRESA